jgi:hypothetical protein
MDEMMSWTNLGTLTGATAAVLLIVQYTKSLFPKIPTRWLALGLAVLILEVTTALVGGPPEAYGLAVLNAVLVASSAMGAYEVTFAPVDAAKRGNEGGAEAGE